MFVLITYALLIVSPILNNSKLCSAERQDPQLLLHSPDDLDYTEVSVKRIGDRLTLVCELSGEDRPQHFVWNWIKANGTQWEHSSFTVTPTGPTLNSTLTKDSLTLEDSGLYMCAATPFSATKYILVQPPGPKHCSRGAFWCGLYCVTAMNVCDGRADCKRGEDEHPSICEHSPCHRANKLNCSNGRCIPEAACCRARGGGVDPTSPLCRQPSCCDEHPRYSRLHAGYVEVEYPPLFEDRHAPDDYGFIQSTIYTVTACALIFMIAVVLLVSAICKMHMKRAALRGYAMADRATAGHYAATAHRFPPCYESSRLLHEAARHSPLQSQNSSPRHVLQCTTECPPEETPSECPENNTPEECRPTGFGLARLSAIFSSRYRQVPTQCLDVEMTDVRSASTNSSPTRNRTQNRLDNYRSPTYCDLNTDFFLHPETSNCGRDLNYMATPVEFFRRRNLRGPDRINLDRLLERPRPLTLQLGRFQLSIPRLGRRSSADTRPDTPNVAELNIDDLDFGRLSNETYTWNGRTIRLLGANFENYPVLNDSSVRPPPYNEAMRYKLYGPPPEYLSRDGLNTNTNTVTPVTTEEQARNNVEMPPGYDELASGVDPNANTSNVNNDTNLLNNGTSNLNNGNSNVNNASSNINNATNTDNNIASNLVDSTRESNATASSVASECNGNTDTISNEVRDVTHNTQATTSVVNNDNNNDIVTCTLSSVIDNLPAIDSDVNANEEVC